MFAEFSPGLQTKQSCQKMFEHNTNISRIVSLDLKANMSTEVEILCNQNDCGLPDLYDMAVVKDQMYISHQPSMISVFEGKSSDAFVTGK